MTSEASASGNILVAWNLIPSLVRSSACCSSWVCEGGHRISVCGNPAARLHPHLGVRSRWNRPRKKSWSRGKRQNGGLERRFTAH
jgi:hypothetical protein